MELSRGNLNTLSRFFRDEKRLLLAVSGNLRKTLEQHFDFYHNGKGFVFNAQDKQLFRQQLEQQYPSFNARQGLPDNIDRIAVSTFVNDDKLADVKPSDGYVLVKSFTCAITIYAQRTALPLGGSARVPVDAIDMTKQSKIIVVENLDIFDYWHLANIPADLHDVLVVYRGHEKSITTGLKSLLEKAGQACGVIMFPDFDPKGIEMCFTTANVNGILAPSLANIQSHLTSYSQIQKFVTQQPSLSYLKQQNSNAWHKLTSLLIQNNLAVMQQAMFAHNIPLVIHPR